MKRIVIVLAILASAAALFAGGGCAPFVPTPYAYDFVAEWGTEGNGAGQLDKPHDVAIDAEGNIYVADTWNHRIQKLSPAGAHLATWGSVGSGPGQFSDPEGIALDADGNIYVADTGNHRIQKLSPAGAPLATWGSQGSDNGQFDLPRGIGLDGTGNIYVADTWNHRIQKLSPAGAHLATWGSVGTGEGEFSHPIAVAVDSMGYVYVADTSNNRVQVFDSAGGYVVTYGSGGSGTLALDRPTGIAVDSSLSVYVTEGRYGSSARVAKIVQLFPGAILYEATWGTRGTGPGQFDTPQGLAVDADGFVYVADTYNNRIQKFRPTVEYVSIAGDDRYATAVAASEKAFPGGAGTVVIATGENWPDALGGAALAGGRNAPILLTRPARLPSAVLTEIRRLGASEAIILGGTGAVSEAVEDALTGELGDGNVTRLGGETRYETAIQVAEAAVNAWGAAFEDHKVALVATGEDFPDALAASPFAAGRGLPVYLAGRTRISADTMAAMVAAGVQEVYILGGTMVVSDAMMADLEDTFGEGNVHRVAGGTRYQTAVLVAEEGVSGAKHSWYKVAIATGESFPDALAGGPLQGRDLSVLLLTRRGTLSADAEAALRANKDTIREVRFLGGESAVSQQVRDAVREALE